MNLARVGGRGGFAERIVPLHDVDGARPEGFGNEDASPPGQRGGRPGQELLGATAHPDPDLARSGFAAGGDDEYANRANHGFVASHASAAPQVRTLNRQPSDG